MIRIIGDSHCCVFSGVDYIIPSGVPDKPTVNLYPGITQHRIGAFTAHNLYKRVQLIKSTMRQEKYKDGDVTFISAGEIDIRAHLTKQPDPLVACDNTIQNYTNCLKEIPGRIGVLLPIIALEDQVNSDKLKAKHYINQELIKICNRNKWYHIGFPGVPPKEYYMDTIHLNQKAMPLFLQQLNDLDLY